MAWLGATYRISAIALIILTMLSWIAGLGKKREQAFVASVAGMNPPVNAFSTVPRSAQDTPPGSSRFAQKADSDKQGESKKKKAKKEPFNIQRITEGMGLQELGPVSPDRQSMVVIGKKPDTAPNLYLLNLKTFRVARPLTSFRAGVGDPIWSPNGDHLAFSGTDDASTFPGVFILETATGKLKKLTHNNFTNKHPVFTSDGKRLLYTSDESPLPDAAFGILHVASVPVDGGKAEYFTDDEASSIEPEISPDGKSVLLVKVQEQSGRHSLWEYGLDGKARRDITEEKLARINSYAFIPSTSSLVIWGQEQPERQDEMYTLDLKTGALASLPDPDLPKRNPSVSPNGKLITFIGSGEEGPCVFLYDISTGALTQLTFKGTNSFTPAFISNGVILFGSDREGEENDVYMIDLTNPVEPGKEKEKKK
jgi:Tol biopolymer transport system component